MACLSKSNNSRILIMNVLFNMSSQKKDLWSDNLIAVLQSKSQIGTKNDDVARVINTVWWKKTEDLFFHKIVSSFLLDSCKGIFSWNSIAKKTKKRTKY